MWKTYEMAAILDAILNFSKYSRVTKMDPPPGYLNKPRKILKAWFRKVERVNSFDFLQVFVREQRKQQLVPVELFVKRKREQFLCLA